MRARADTPACQARLLHHTVKTFVAEMNKEGYSQEASYMVLAKAEMVPAGIPTPIICQPVPVQSSRAVLLLL